MNAYTQAKSQRQPSLSDGPPVTVTGAFEPPTSQETQDKANLDLLREGFNQGISGYRQSRDYLFKRVLHHYVHCFIWQTAIADRRCQAVESMQIHRLSQYLWQWSPHFLVDLFSLEAKAYAKKKQGVKANSHSESVWE